MNALLYPIFLPFVGWVWLLAVLDVVFGTHSTQDTGPTAGPLAAAGFFVMVFVLGLLLQIVVGLPSLSILKRVRQLAAHLLFAVVSSVILSLAASLWFRVPQFGETIFTILPFAVLCFTPPFLLGYYHAYAHSRPQPAEQ